MDIIPLDDPESNCPLVSRITYIYVLISPDSGEIRYVGKSDNPQRRFSEHLSREKTTYKGRWIASLHRKGLIPLLQIVKIVPHAEWQEYERFYIALYRSHGHPLTNSNDGGYGSDISPETRAKMSAAHLGKKHSPEAIAKTAAANRGKKRGPLPKEVRQKMAASRKGKKRPPEVIAKMVATKRERGWKPSPESIAKRVSAITGRKLPPRSEEWKRKIGNANKGKKRSDEIRAQQSASRKGRMPVFGKGTKHTPESLAKMSAASKGRKQSPETIAKRVATQKRNRAIRQNPPDTPTLWE